MTTQVNKSKNKHITISKNNNNNYSDNTHVTNISLDRNDNSLSDKDNQQA